MVKRRKLKFSIPEYREKKPAYLKMGYKEIEYKEKGINAIVTLEIEETKEHYYKLRELENLLNRKGPPFLPILIMVIIAFGLLATFTIFIARSLKYGLEFDLLSNALGYLLPAILFLTLDTVYTIFYFKINNKIITAYRPTPEEFDDLVDKIKNS